MYEGWEIQRWETPVSNAKSLMMVSLTDDGKLSILLQDHHDLQHRQFSFVFSNYPAYRNILEEYRTKLWEKIGKRSLGWTLVVPNSPWITALAANEPLLDTHQNTLCHYIIGTEDDVIEILSPEPPKITEVPLETQSKAVGKSRAHYHPEDQTEHV